MVNMNLINEAVKLAARLFEQEGIAVNNEAIENSAKEWYNHTDITDAEELAAAVWIGEYNPKITYGNILDLKEMLFPTEPLEMQHFHIGEIEEAMRDEEWQ